MPSMEASSRNSMDAIKSEHQSKNSSRSGTPPDGIPVRSTAAHDKAEQSRSSRIADNDTTQQSHMKSWLPPIPNFVNSEYLAQHHSLKPSVRTGSAYIKRHQAARGLLPGQARMELLRNDEIPGRPGPAVRSAILAALAVNAELLPARIEQEPEVEAAQIQWSTTSVGDLEALDSILDQLVVKDFSMREALLKGPLISFETIVPNPVAPRHFFQLEPEYKDETFITGVQGVEVTEDAEALEQPQAAPAPEPEPEVAAAPIPDRPEPHTAGVAEMPPFPRGARAMQETDHEGLRQSIPIPILPKLARAYITHKPSGHLKVPPLPPPTAEYLVKSRPAGVIAAPSYDELCTHIRDVQRQYTCGTANDKAGSGASMQNNTNMYISGLDGPSLDDMVNYEELPVGLERMRPSFVALKKGSARGVKTRSASRERSARQTKGLAASGALAPWEGTGDISRQH